jgi:putative ABC transport system ATP-binding protein
MPHAVLVENVWKTYAGGEAPVHALADVSLTVEAGEFVAIMGASGSGKSTLLHLCAALDRPTRGTIQVAGEALANRSDQFLTLFRRRKIGVVFQQFNLIPTLTCRENIALPALLDHQPESKFTTRLDELLALLRIDHRAAHRPDALSGGEQQRTAIARALLLNPPVLFADEPTGNLDSNAADQFWEALGRATGSQTSIVMVTHEPAAAMHADRVVVLRDGKVAGEITVHECADATVLAQRYQGLARGESKRIGTEALRH